MTQEKRLMKIADQYTQITKILNHIVEYPRPKTDLMYEARFNSKQILFYLDFLIQKQMIEKKKGNTITGKITNVYAITMKGREVLKQLLIIKELLS